MKKRSMLPLISCRWSSLNLKELKKREREKFNTIKLFKRLKGEREKC